MTPPPSRPHPYSLSLMAPPSLTQGSVNQEWGADLDFVPPSESTVSTAAWFDSLFWGGTEAVGGTDGEDGLAVDGWADAAGAGGLSPAELLRLSQPQPQASRAAGLSAGVFSLLPAKDESDDEDLGEEYEEGKKVRQVRRGAGVCWVCVAAPGPPRLHHPCLPLCTRGLPRAMPSLAAIDKPGCSFPSALTPDA